MDYFKTNNFISNFNTLFFLILLLIIGSLFIFEYKSYAKIMLPAQVGLELADPAIPGKPLALVITATSKVPISSGKIILTTPPIGTEPSNNILLWFGSSNEAFTHMLEYIIPILPIGKYQFRVTFEFTQQHKESRIMKVGKNLYVDSRTDVILSSNVSFTQIKRIELKNELERRGLSNLPETQQKTLAPDLMRQLDELNKLETVPQAIGDDTILEMMPGLQRAPIQGTKEEVPGTSDTLQEKGSLNQPMKAPLQGTKEAIINAHDENQKLTAPPHITENDYSKSRQAQEKRSVH